MTKGKLLLTLNGLRVSHVLTGNDMPPTAEVCFLNNLKTPSARLHAFGYYRQNHYLCTRKTTHRGMEQW